MAVYAESQVVIMTHGAALGNVLFMSPVSHFCGCCITLDQLHVSSMLMLGFA